MQKKWGMRFSRAVWVAALSLTATVAVAQDVPAGTVVPLYSNTPTLQGLFGQWFVPQAQQAQRSAHALHHALQTYCAKPQSDVDSVREKFAQASQDWIRLSSVAMGPLIERRSARLVDFQPLRVASLQKSLQTQPKDLQALERIGTPAKGFPALEYLLWKQVPVSATPACHYAILLAEEITAEMQVLAQDFEVLKKKDWPHSGDDAMNTMAEFINQWLGGLERLYWQNMEKPVRSAGSKAPELIRMVSGATLATWQAQWQGVRELAIRVDRRLPTAGVDLVPIETFLRGRGHAALADRWFEAIQEADAAMRHLQSTDLATVEATVKPLARLKRLMETELAPALEVSIGFSDTDGD